MFGAGTDLSLASDIRGETPVKISIGAYDSDGFYRTLRSSGGDYSSAITAEATMQADLTATGDRSYLEAYNDWPSGLPEEFGIVGWTTSATYYFTFRAAAGEAHGGVIGAGFWISGLPTTADNRTIRVEVDYTVIEDIEVNVTTAQQAHGVDMRGECAYGVVNRCILKHGSGGGSVVALVFRGDNLTARNCELIGTNALA